MSITNLTFLFLFLPPVLLLRCVLPGRVREFMLFAASLVFYLYCDTRFFPLFFLSAIVNTVVSGLLVRAEKKGTRRLLLWAGILFNLGLLGYFKYMNFFMQNLYRVVRVPLPMREEVLPAGISFFTFKAISMLVDLSRGRIRPEAYSPLRAALYLTFFPQIASGPLARYEHFDAGRDTKRGLPPSFSRGVCRFLCGFSKKVLLADTLSRITAETFSTDPHQLGFRMAWLGAVSYSLQLYYDFSGYSDMAIGIGNMLGYECPENFNFPYISASVSEFWRRWHITLGAWFRDYIYIPLGGSRVKSRSRLYLNLFAVWICTGLWHGARWSFVFWGMAHFILIAFEKGTGLPDRLRKGWQKVLYRILVLFFINFTWVIFRADGLKNGIRYILVMVCPWRFAPAAGAALDRTRFLFVFHDYFIFLLGAVLFAVPFCDRITRRLRHGGKDAARPALTIWYGIQTVFLIFCFVWAVSFAVSAGNNPFTYANF